jgi:hypothetical protein
MTIAELFNKYLSDKCTSHSYGDFYADLLTPLRDRPITLLEVGVDQGGSLRAWQEFLPLARIVGMDNYAQPSLPDGITLVRADSTDKTQVDEALGDLRFDVIIDDACHWIQEQVLTFENLWPRLNDGCLYVCEDIQRLEEAKETFEPLGFEFIDLRNKKNRGDDVLAVKRKPAAAPEYFI